MAVKDLRKTIRELQNVFDTDGRAMAELNKDQLATYSAALGQVNDILAWLAKLPIDLPPESMPEAAQTTPLKKPGRKWSPKEDSRLAAEFKQKVTVSEIAARHDRSVGAIRARFALLGLSEPTTPRELKAFRRGFTKGKIPREAWNHRRLVSAIWLASTRLPPSGVLLEIEEALRLMDARDGLLPTDRTSFHKTYIAAWVSLIYDRSIRLPGASLRAFLTEYPELLDSRLVLNHFSEGLLRCAEARQHLLQPDRQALPELVFEPSDPQPSKTLGPG